MLHIGAALIDPAARTVDADGEARRLSPKSMAVLNALIEADGDVLSRGGLIERVWPNVCVGEEVLTQAIAGDPNLSDAHSAMALCDLMAMLHRWRPDTLDAIAEASAAATRAIALDESDATGHGVLGMADMFARNFDAAREHLVAVKQQVLRCDGCPDIGGC